MIKKLKALELNFSVFKATMIVGVFALLSRIVGLIRDRLFASNFGAGDTLDIYYASFRIPDLVFNLLILGTLSVAFIPVFTELLITDKPRAYRVANSILNLSFCIMTLICFVLIFFAEPITHLLVPGFNGQKFLDTVTLTRIFLLSPIIFTVSNLFSSILNSQKKFIIANLAPILYNLGIIFGLLYLYPSYGLVGLGYGVIIGAILHLLVQIPESIRFGYAWQAIMDLKDPAVKKIVTLFLPRILGVDNSQISLLIGSIVGSVLATGSISVFNLANNLQAVPLGVFAISTAVAIFPLLSELYAKKDTENFAKNLANGIIQILFFMIPLSIALLIYRAHIVRLAFGTGEFNWEDTILTFNTLGMFAFSLFAQGLSPLLARAFYARQNTKIPVTVGVFTMVINASLALYLGKMFGVAGVAGAFSIASIFNAGVLFSILRTKISKESSTDSRVISSFDENLASAISKIIISSIIMGIVGYGMLYIIEPVINTHKVFGLFIQLSSSAILATATYLSISSYLKLAQAQNLLTPILPKRFK